MRIVLFTMKSLNEKHKNVRFALSLSQANAFRTIFLTAWIQTDIHIAFKINGCPTIIDKVQMIVCKQSQLAT